MIISAVLSGGSSSRFPTNKLFYRVGGRTLVEYVIDCLRMCRAISKVIVITSVFNASRFEDLGVDVVLDNLSIGPMGGVLTALKMFKRVLVVGGDMPNIRCGFIEKLLSLCGDEDAACIPVWSSGYMEPLAAVYTNRFLPVLEYGLYRGIYSIQKLIKVTGVKVRAIHIEEELVDYLESFVNINLPEDLVRIKLWW